jgi:hypothetical protein
LKKPRQWTKSDLLGAVLLFPLGISAVVGGLVFRHSFGHQWWQFELAALAIIGGGIISLRWGAITAFAWLFLRPVLAANHDDYPTIACGFPFLAFGVACGLLSVTMPNSLATVGITLMVSSFISWLLALLVMISAIIMKAVKR